jgi:hypothetical protein
MSLCTVPAYKPFTLVPVAARTANGIFIRLWARLPAVAGVSVRTANFSGAPNSFGSATAAPCAKFWSTTGRSTKFAQELLGYHFQVFHLPARMMRDVDGLSRQFDDPLLASYFTTADALALSDATERPAAYDPATFTSHNPLKCPPHMTPPPSTDIQHASSFPLLLAPETATAVFLDRAVLANLPLRYQPTAHAAAGNPPTTTCHPVAPSPSSVRNGSHFLLMNHTLAWFSLTPQFGAIPSALADHSELFPLASLIFQLPLLPATAMCRASVPSSYFLPCSLTALL